MPRQYVTRAEVLESPYGSMMASFLKASTTEAIDKLIFRASKRADTFCMRRLQAPGSTTVAGSGTLAAGVTSLPVASTLTLDNEDEQAAVIGSGATQETILITSGGVSVTSYLPPYPGNLTLATPTQYSHNVGEPVQFVYKEVTEAGSVGGGDAFVQALETQQAEIAIAHAPHLSIKSLTRTVWLRNTPIIAVTGIEHSYSFNNTYVPLSANIISIDARDGWYSFNLGTFVTPQGLMRTTYTGGYLSVPEDVKQAVLFYFADLCQPFVNPGNAIEVQRGKVRYKYSAGVKSKTPLQEQAEEALKRYRRTV